MRRHPSFFAAALVAVVMLAWEAKPVVEPIFWGAQIVNDFDHIAATPNCWVDTIQKVSESDAKTAGLLKCNTEMSKATGSLGPHAVRFTVALLSLGLMAAL